MDNIYYYRNRLRRKSKSILLLSLFFLSVFSSRAQNLVWEENFDEPTINPETWTFDFGDGCERGICGWGNNELEYYTSRPENARIEEGNLLIEARREDFGGKPYTSARLKTYGRVHFKYGTLEARIKVSDLGNGLWPAFWMLGATGTWPASGEIDILEMGSAEAISNNVVNRQVGAAVHWEHNDSHASYSTKHVSETDLHDEYHIYKVEWNQEFIRIFIDDIQYYVIDISGGAGADLEEFHQSHYILLNLAVGGLYTGIPSVEGVTAPLPGKMYVDYLKLYQDPADGGELYLGKNNAIAGNFGVYTETAPVSAELTYGEDANLYIWNNLSNIAGAEAFEGNEVLALRATSGQWFGFGVDNQPKNLLNFAEQGSLKFHLKTSYTGQFKVGINSAHGESWVNFSAGVEKFGLLRDGQWHEVIIPLSEFNKPEMGMNIDLGSVSQSFMFAGDPAAGDAEFYIDNIYYSGGVTENPAPTVSLTAPAHEALLPSGESMTIEATAADENGTVTKVDFYQGTFLLGTDETSPYSYTWENVPAGVYNLTARATDDEGIVTASQTVQVFVSPENNAAPTISLSSPANGASFVTPATITITADAVDADGSIYKVEFYNGESLLGTDLTAPYTFSWSNVAAGNYTITAKAIDSGKKSATAEPVSVVVEDNSVVSDRFGVYSEDPAISTKLVYGLDANLYVWNGLTALGGATPYEGTDVLAFGVAAGSWFGFGIDNNLKNLSHFANGSLKFHMKTGYAGAFSIGMKTGSTESWMEFPAGVEKYGLLRDGEWHEVTIPLRELANLDLTAVDQAFMFVGDAPAANTEFYFDHIYFSAEAVNSAPGVTLTSPAGNATYNAPASIHIEATATDTDGNIAKVEFYEGGTLLGVDESSPYTFDWANVAAGSYTLTAKAYDNEAAAATSAPVEVVVENPAANGPNLALNQPVVVSSEENAGTPGTAAVDGDLNTRWSSAFSDPQWLYVDLGSEYDLSRVKITWEGAYAKDYVVQLSSDAENWEDVKVVNDNTNLVNDHKDISGSARYVRIYGTERATPYGYSFFELEVYGNQATAYCGTAENGDYSYSAVTEGENVTFTFHPEAPIAGSNMAIIYIREGGQGVYPGYGMAKTVSGDFTFAKTIPGGTELSIYFTYAVPGGGERNSLANPHSYVVGEVCGSEPSNTPPTVILTAPADGSLVDGPADILIEATASDAEGNVVRVEFYEGDSLLATDESEPYRYTWLQKGEGSYAIRAVAYDEEGLSAKSEVVEVTVQCVSVFYADTDGDGFGNADESITACVAPEGYISQAGDCDDTDASINPDASDLCDGIDRNCDGLVRLPVETPVVTAIPLGHEHAGGDELTIYLGYGAQSIQLQATANEAVSFRWTTAEGSVLGSGETLLFEPTEAGTYVLTLTATNASDCSAGTNVTISVVDVRCGKKLDKVLICHKGKDLCVAPAAVQAHLAHGDQLGGCGAGVQMDASNSGKNKNALAVYPGSDIRVYPNPASGRVKVELTAEDMERVSLAVYDLNGALMKSVSEGEQGEGAASIFEFDTRELKSGMYLIYLTIGEKVVVKPLMVLH